MRADSVLRVNIAKHPSSSVEIYHHRPPFLWLPTLRCEHANLDIRALRLATVDGVVVDAPHGLLRPAAKDQGAGGSGGSHRLQLDLLQVDEVLVVESGVVRVQPVPDGLVEGIWRPWGRIGRHEELWSAGWRSVRLCWSRMDAGT